jgi:hypothetical protein
MVDVSYQMVLSTLQTVGLLVGIYYYLMVLRNQEKNQQISIRNQELTLESQELSRKALEQSAETRQAQLLMQVYGTWMSPDFQRREYELMTWDWNTFEEWEEKYGPEKNLEAYLTWASVSSFYEGLGVFVKRGYIDAEVIDDLISSWVIRQWEKFGPIVKEFRSRYNNPASGEYVEYLYNQIKPIWDREHNAIQAKHTIPKQE